MPAEGERTSSFGLSREALDCGQHRGRVVGEWSIVRESVGSAATSPDHTDVGAQHADIGQAISGVRESEA
jgi:hypothetical protein